jgi:hypothetical protein
LGQANFVFDPSSEPWVTADQLSEAFGVAKSTMGSKAKQVRDLLRISPFSLEFQRADMIDQNPLVWIIDVNGFAVDARHAGLDIQVEAYQRGFIPYIPAFGPDGTAPNEEKQVAGTASAAAPPEAAGLLEHASELKGQLIDFACSQRFSWQLEKAVSEGIGGPVTDEREFANLLDSFILQRPLADGRTVVEVFVCEHPEFAEADRRMLLGWREVVEGVFEILERSGDAIIAVNLVDERTYRIRANAGPRALVPMRPGLFMTARVVPVGDDWMLSGVQRLFPASQRAAMLQLAAEQVTWHP